MSSKSLLLTSSQRLQAEEISEPEPLGGGFVTHQVLVQGINLLPVGVQPRPISAHFAAAGPSIEANVDGSVTPVTFDLAPADPDIYRIERLRLTIVATTAVGLSGFGNLAVLGQGLLLQVLNTDNVEIFDVLAGVPIQSGFDLHELGTVETVALGTEHMLIAEIVLASPIRLEAGFGEKLRLTVRDNLSTLTRVRLRGIGFVENRRS